MGALSLDEGVSLRATARVAMAGPAWRPWLVAVDVSAQIVINRPLDAVASYSSDPANAPRWYSRIQSVTWMTPPPLRVGSQLNFVAHFLGRRLAYTYEVVEYEPSERLVLRTAAGSFPMETTYAWHAVGESATRMLLQNRGRPAGFAVPLVPLMAKAVRHANRQDLRRLKSILEAHDAGSPAP